MTITYGSVRTWQAEPLGTAGDGLKADVKALESSRDAVETQAIPASWSGLARIVAQARRNGLVAAMDTHIEGKTTMQKALYDAEAQVTEIERLVKDVEGQAKAQEFTIASDGSVSDTSTPPTFENRYEAEEWSASRSNLAQAIADEVSTILGKAAAVDATLANGIPAGHVQDVDEYGTASPEVAEQWSQLSDGERRAIIEQMIRELAEANGVEMPDITWEDDSWGSNGMWSDGEPGTVSLNEGLLDETRILHTVAHELRHAQQYEAIRDHDDWQFPWEDDPFDEHEDNGITEDQVEEWKENFDDYQSTSNPGVSYEDYFTQPVEEDARDAGQDYLDGLTADEIDRLEEASR